MALPNSAFLFIKPHAVTEQVKALVKETLAARGIAIRAEGEIKCEVIDEKKLIDQHYYAIASKATILTPDQLNVPADKFEEKFGRPWAEALASGDVVNAMDACKRLEISADDLDAAWGRCKKADKLIKFGGGFYCGLVEIEGKPPLYAFNGFFMSMRSKFTKPGESIYYFNVDFDAAALKWADFRGAVLGPTDPATAPADSLRGVLYAKWESLGLKAQPDTGDNGVHASASPFEGLAERLNWLGAKLPDEPFGAALLGAGIPEQVIRDWSVDPQVKQPDGKMGSLFDSLEDMDAGDCLEKAKAIHAAA